MAVKFCTGGSLSARLPVLITALLLLAPVQSINEGAAEEVALSLPSGPLEKLCAACTQAVEQLELLLADPSLVNRSVALLESAVCEQLPPEQEAQCNDAVQEYVPVIFSELEVEITVENICVRTAKVCPPDPPTTPTRSGGAEGPEECYACRLVVKLLKKHLSNPKTQAKIKDFLESKCSAIGNTTMAHECLDGVDKFLPVVFANLNIILDDKKLCKEASLCVLAES